MKLPSCQWHLCKISLTFFTYVIDMKNNVIDSDFSCQWHFRNVIDICTKCQWHSSNVNDIWPAIIRRHNIYEHKCTSKIWLDRISMLKLTLKVFNFRHKYKSFISFLEFFWLFLGCSYRLYKITTCNFLYGIQSKVVRLLHICSRLLRRVFYDARSCSPSAVFPSLLHHISIKVKILKSLFY